MIRKFPLLLISFIVALSCYGLQLRAFGEARPLVVYYWNFGEEVIGFLQDAEKFPGIDLNSEKTNLTDYDIFMVLVHPNDPKKMSILNILDLKEAAYERVASGEISISKARYYFPENKKVRIFLLNGPSLNKETATCQAHILYDIFVTSDFQRLSGSSLNSELECRID